MGQCYRQVVVQCDKHERHETVERQVVGKCDRQLVGKCDSKLWDRCDRHVMRLWRDESWDSVTDKLWYSVTNMHVMRL